MAFEFYRFYLIDVHDCGVKYFGCEFEAENNESVVCNLEGDCCVSYDTFGSVKR